MAATLYTPATCAEILSCFLFLMNFAEVRSGSYIGIVMMMMMIMIMIMNDHKDDHDDHDHDHDHSQRHASRLTLRNVQVRGGQPQLDASAAGHRHGSGT